MVLTRFLHLQIWDEYNEYVQYDNKLDTNWGITSGNVKLDKILMSEQLNYGEINSAKLELQVFGLDVDLSNRKIKLEAIDAVVEDDYLVDDSQNYIVTDALDFITVGTLDPEHVFPLFCGYIESADKDYMSTDRNIEAYDWFYYHRDDNIADWWNDWWMENSPYSPTTVTTVNVAQFLDDLFTELGLTSSKVYLELPGASLEITNPFVYVSTTGSSTVIDYFVTELKLGDILSMLGKMCSWTPIIDGDFTNVDFIWLDNGNTYNLEGNMEKEECEWEDFQTDVITGVAIYDSSSHLAQSYGTTTNMYQVVGNVFILNMSAQQLSSRAQWIYNQVKDIQFTPSKIKCIVSDLYHRLGDKVVTDKGTSYIFQQSLSGVLLVDEEINCPSKNGRTLDTKVEDVNDAIIEGAKSAIFEKDIDHMTVEYSNKIAGLTTRVNQNTQAITAEAQRAQLQEEIAGVVTGYSVAIPPDIDPNTGKVLYPGLLDLETNITLERPLANGIKFGVWVRDMPAQYATYEKELVFEIQEAPGVPPFVAMYPIYYSEATPLTNQYSSGVILHLMYMANQQITIGTSTVTRTGFWIGADDSYAKISVTADEILQEVSSGYVDINSYNSEVQNLQNQIDGYIEYWDGDNVVPTLQNYPAEDWTTEAELGRHIGDLYRNHYTQTVGTSTVNVTDYYRFDRSIQGTSTVYSWTLLGAGDVDEALRKADEANAKAEAAQEQLDALEASTTTQFASVTTRINGVTTRVSGVEKVSPVAKTFNGSVSSYSDGKLFVFTEAVTNLGNGNRFSILLPSHWNDYSTYNKYIKITSDGNPNPNTNTFPVYYSGTTKLTNQLGAGDTLNIRYYETYSYITGANKKAFVIENSDQTYQRLETELNVERGRIVMRAEATSGGKSKLVSARFDATGESSEIYLGADSIILSAEEAMSFLSGGTLTLAGEDGVVIDSPNFKVRRNGTVEVTGAITATSLTLGDGVDVPASQIDGLADVAISGDADDLDGLADVATSGEYSDLANTPNLTVYIQKDGTIGSTPSEGATGFVVSSQGLLRASNAVIYGTIWASNGRFAGELQASTGKIAGLNITSDSIQKSSSTSGFSLSADNLYFSSGANEANTMNITSTGLSTKGYIEAEVIRRKDSSGKWAGINRDLNTTLTNINTNLTNLSTSVAYVGDYKSGDSQGDVSVSSSTVRSIASVTLATGIWVITARANFDSNTTGDRYVCISTAQHSISGRGQSAVRLDAISGNATQIVTTRIVTTGGTYYLTVEQDSGSSLLCSGGITAVRIR